MSFVHILRRPAADITAAIKDAMRAAFKELPVASRHRADLPYAIKDLSRMLTQERGALAQSYWTSPRFLSAYVHYFLPWNVYRLAWLLPQLSLRLAPGSQVVDLGSGPLTLPIALWCACPAVRQIPLRFDCYDVAAKPLEIGRNILQNLMGKESPWAIHTHRAAIDTCVPRLPDSVDLLMAGNVLNEVPAPRQGTLEDRLGGIVRSMSRKLSQEGQLLLIEPGTRLGGKTVALSRKAAVHAGLQPLAPCTHAGPCPMHDQSAYQATAPIFSGWCHFLYPAANAPQDLLALAQKAGFERENLALSFIFAQRSSSPTSIQKQKRDAEQWSNGPSSDELADLEALYQQVIGQGEDTQEYDDEEEYTVEQPVMAAPENMQELVDLRIISDLIRLPEEDEAARYACSKYGLVLLLRAAHCYPGGGVAARLVAENGVAMRDKKTSALLMTPVQDFTGMHEKRSGLEHGGADAHHSRPVGKSVKSRVPSDRPERMEKDRPARAQAERIPRTESDGSIRTGRGRSTRTEGDTSADTNRRKATRSKASFTPQEEGASNARRGSKGKDGSGARKKTGVQKKKLP